MATPACVRRFGVVASTTVLAIAALGGVASAAPGNGNSNSNSNAAQHGQSDQHNQNGQNGNGAAGSHVTGGTAGTSGDPTQPQPVSTADANTGGANGQCPGGPYCSTRDGSPSGNGNGNGQATGKPCAGCVGKADNKNPKGQMPNGSDNNAGYECDRNHGIGRSNPAHTGCTTSTPPVTTGTCPSGQVMVAGTCTTPSTTGSTSGPAGGSTDGSTSGPTVLGTGFTRHPVAGASTGVPTSVLGERVVRTPAVAAAASSLPFTGAPTGELLLLATAALTAGGALAFAGRRRQLG